MKENYYSIGEVSKITNLSIQTLRYYDQIDLFKPSYIDPKTNYRYYSESKLYYLDLIKSLKYLGTPLEDIKQAQNYTIEELVEFLEEQEQVIESRIQRLKEAQYTLLKSKKQMVEQLAIKTFNEVYIRNEESTRLLKIKAEDIIPEYIPNSYFSALMKTLEREGSVTPSRYGGTFPLEKYDSIKDITYNSVFMPLLTDRDIRVTRDDMDLIMTAEGRYACISFIFSLDAYFEQYEKLYHYITSHQLTVESDVYEYFMPTSYSPNRKEQFIVEFKVKIND